MGSNWFIIVKNIANVFNLDDFTKIDYNDRSKDLPEELLGGQLGSVLTCNKDHYNYKQILWTDGKQKKQINDH